MKDAQHLNLQGQAQEKLQYMSWLPGTALKILVISGGQGVPVRSTGGKDGMEMR